MNCRCSVAFRVRQTFPITSEPMELPVLRSPPRAEVPTAGRGCCPQQRFRSCCFCLLQPRDSHDYFHLGFFISRLGDLPSAHFPLKNARLLTVSWVSCLLAKHLQQHIISALLMSNKTAKNYMPVLIYATLVGITLEMHEFHVSC